MDGHAGHARPLASWRATGASCMCSRTVHSCWLRAERTGSYRCRILKGALHFAALSSFGQQEWARVQQLLYLTRLKGDPQFAAAINISACEYRPTEEITLTHIWYVTHGPQQQWLVSLGGKQHTFGRAFSCSTTRGHSYSNIHNSRSQSQMSMFGWETAHIWESILM
jgi:hypothetical protein